MKPSRRIADIPESLNLVLHARAQELQRRTGDVVNMSVGEPDFPAPAVVRAAAAAKAESGDVRYTPAAGVRSLRERIALHVSRTRGLEGAAAVRPEQVVVCHSAKHALSNTILALVEPGDEVLLPAPAWLSYFEQIRIAGGTPVWVPGREDHGPDLEALRAAIGPRTRGVLINSPNNPSGYVWSAAETAALAALACEHDLWILSDEIYRRLVYEGAPNPSPIALDAIASPTLAAAARERTIVVDGASKCFAMTGYRIGFLVAPVALATAVTRLQSHLTGSPNAISQAAYEAALGSDDDEPPEVARMVATYAERRALLVPGLVSLGLRTALPRGAYYALSDVRSFLDQRGVSGFCEDLLDAERVAIVPGTVFAVDGHVRFSFAVDVDTIREALERLGRFLARTRQRT